MRLTRRLLVGLYATVALLLVIASADALVMKRVLVTGGNKGIGKAICERLLTEYDNVHVLLGSRDAARGQQAVADILKSVKKDNCKERLELLSIDTSSDESVSQAAATVAASGQPLYGIVNNAGIMKAPLKQVVNVNYFGPKRVWEAFQSQLQTPGGRVVNIASASGPNFVSSLDAKDPLYQTLAEPWTIEGNRFAEIDRIAKEYETGNAYGFSKALVNAYTLLLAREYPALVINSVTPGWIQTDMTAGSAAQNSPAQGAVPPVWLLLSDDLAAVPTGRYYGSDCVRSPLHYYRGPGDEPYVGPDGLEIAKKESSSQSVGK